MIFVLKGTETNKDQKSFFLKFGFWVILNIDLRYDMLYFFLLQGLKEKRQKVMYDSKNLYRVSDATRSGMIVYMAARQYNVPESTLRDRTRGNILVDATLGFDTIFKRSEERKLVDHINYMADIGYGYKSNILYMASDLAKSLNKNTKSTDHLSNCWFYGFLKRWPDLKIAKPQKLSVARATDIDDGDDDEEKCGFA